MLLYVALGLAFVIYLALIWHFSFWDRNGIPGESGMFLFGSVLESVSMKKHFAILANEWYRKYANYPYFGYYRGSTAVLMVRDIELAKDVLIKDFNSFSTNDFIVDEHLDPLMVANPFFSSGKRWKQNRTMITPIFTNNKMKIVFPLIKSTCHKMEKYLNVRMGETEDSRELATKFTTDNAIMCSFSLNAEAFENPKSEFREMGRRLFKQSRMQAIKFMVVLFAPWLVKYIRLSIIPKDMDKWFRNFVKSNVESRQMDQATEDFLQMLMNISKTTKLSYLELAGHSMSFFIEGFETSSSVLSHAMFEIARNPDIQEKLHDEIVRTLTADDNELNFDALQQMEYLDAVMHEVLRLYPVLLTLNKVCTVPYQLKPLPGQKQGFTIQPGTPVVIPVYSFQRDAQFYADPELFDPNRFLPEQRKTIPKGAYLAFGDGPRMCIGMRFGLAQTKAALATAVKSYKLSLSPDCKPYKIDPKYFMNAPLNPILLKFEKRAK